MEVYPGLKMEAVSAELKSYVRACRRNRSCDGALEAAEAGIRHAVALSDGIIRDMCLHIANSGGKRLRPRLVLHSGLMFTPLNMKMVNAAVAAELIHMASLAHDDVIDRSDMRRGRPSANSLWGERAAVLCGDWLFARAFGMLSARGMSQCLNLMVGAIQQMCRGELLQAGFTGNFDIGQEDYCERAAGKTARLLEACCKCGALAGGADEARAQALGEYGLNIGMAFQIADDILDLRGDARLMGKPAGEDIRQGVATLPVILLLRHGEYGRPARGLLSKGSLSTRDMAALNALLDESGALAQTRNIASSFIEKAQRSLAGLPDTESRAFLHDLAAGLGKREK